MKPHGSRWSRRGRPLILVTIALFQWLWLGQGSSAGVIHVPSQFPTIQAAINAANTGDEVVLADGTYSGPGNVNVRFAGKAITVRSANGPAACMIDCQQTARGFIFDNEETAASVLRGVTIHHGQAVPDASLFYPNSGGGVYIHWSSPTIEQCILSACSAVGVGGMYLNGSTSIVRDCVFSASTGVGAVAAPDSCCTFDGCSFTQNAGSFALSLFFDLGGCSGPTVITDCSFTSNLGAAIVSMYGSTIIERTTFTANGGLGLNVLHGTHTLTDCVFSDHPGLAMQSQLHESGHITLTNVEFAGNQGGGLSLGLGGTTRIAGCSFIENSAANGGGLRINTSSPAAVSSKSACSRTTPPAPGRWAMEGRSSSTLKPFTSRIAGSSRIPQPATAARFMPSLNRPCVSRAAPSSVIAPRAAAPSRRSARRPSSPTARCSTIPPAPPAVLSTVSTAL